MPKAVNVYPLKKRADFLRIAKSGIRRALPCFVLQSDSNELDVARVGYTVSKKTSKLAVERNRIKRRLRAAVAANASLFESGKDYVLIGRAESLRRDFEQLKTDVKYALKKLGANG